MLLILLWILGLTFYHARERKKARKARQGQAREVYEEHVRRLELPPSWVEVTDILAKYMRRPEDSYLIFENPQSFNAAASAALADDAVSEGTIAALRVQLGFSVGEGGSPISTASLKEGSTVFVRMREDQSPVRATVLAQDPHHLRLQLPHEGPHFPTGRAVEVFYQNDRGVFRLSTDVLGQEERTLSLRHTERVSHEQKRKFFRKRVSEPARVRHDTEDAEPLFTRLLDLGGGGASFANPDGVFKLGDLVRIDLTARDGTHLSLHAKVLRLSEQGNVCHVEFYSVRESLRDKIYNLIFAPPKKQPREQE